jgi:DNA replication and repair protein RecF
VSAALQKAAIRRLVLTQYRNHDRLELETGGLPVVLSGANGAGKTNILEAISLLGPGRGLRGADLAQVSRAGPDGGPWAVSAVVETGSGEEHRIGIGLEAGPEAGARRIARIDGRNAGPKDLADAIRLIWMTPAHDRLFAGPASERRKFLDRLVFAATPEHAAVATSYDKAMRERSRLLSQEAPDRRWLSVIETEMAASAVALAVARIEAVDGLQAAIEGRADSAFPKAALALDGLLEAKLRAGQAASGLEDWFAGHLSGVRLRDAAAGRAIDGPHRTDLSALHLANGMDAALCSTGEQKALVTGLVLAQAHRIAGGFSGGFAGDDGPNPVVLLDEAAAHFDPARRAALCEALLALPGQAWVTGTDDGLFDGFAGAAARFEVRAGETSRLV